MDYIQNAGTSKNQTSETMPITASGLTPKLIIKIADLDQTSFYDFYALTTVECSDFPDEHQIRMCNFLKSFTVTKVLDDLLSIISRAVIREARHVNNPQAVSMN